MDRGTPPAEVRLDAELLRALLGDQHPDLAALPIEPVDEGWDNGMFRLGDTLAARLPRRAVSAALVEREQRWLPLLAPALPLAIPVPLRAGEPGRGYPWRWSIVPWIDGAPSDESPLAASEAPRLAAFLRALHQPAPADAPVSAVRGVPLARRAESATERLERLASETVFVTPAVRTAWREGLEARPADTPRWIHGDLHSRNVLASAGRITGVIDWGDLNAGDVATDLAGIWMLLDQPAARREALAAYGASAAQVARARAWAVLFGALLLDTGWVDRPRHAAIGMAVFRRLGADA